MPSIGSNATSLRATTQWNTDHLNKHYVAPHMCICSSGRIWQQTEMRVGIYFVTWPRCYEPVGPVGFCRDTCSLHHAPLSSCGRQMRLTQNTGRVSLCARYLILHGDYIKEEAIGRTCRVHGQLKGAYRIIVKHWKLGARRRRWEDIVMCVREIKRNTIVLNF